MADNVKRIDRAEITRRVEQAEKLLQKGKTADALECYLQLLPLDPGNDAVRQMAADLCLSLQRIPEAVTLLGELFERQIQAGDATRASLTYKKLARFANPSWQQKARFGQLLESSNRRLALETYENSFEELIKRADKVNALVVLKRIATLDSGERNLLRLAELASGAGEGKTAAAAYLRLAQSAERAGGNSAQWYQRAYEEDSHDPQIALAYGRTLLGQGQAGAAIFVLEPQVKANGPEARELREAYSRALLEANRLSEAAPFVWEQFEQNPSRVADIGKLIGLLIDASQDKDAVALARQLDQHQRRRGERKGFAAMMQDITASRRPSPEVLEFMGELFNSSNRETDYAQTLAKLFDLYFSMGEFGKAADCLDRALEVDPYESGHQKRLESLRGKIEDSRYKSIAMRFSGTSTGKAPAAEPVRSGGEPVLGAAALQDLMLQAEILVQYGMRSKAMERVQRIQELFPREEERNEDLQRLYMAVGLTPKYAPSPAAAPSPSAAPPPARMPAPPAPDTTDVSNLTRVAEITRKLYRQSNADAVMSTAASEIGGQWKASRCIVAMRKPGLPPTALTEYCGEGIKPATPAQLAVIVKAVQEPAITRGTLTLANVQAAQEVQEIRDALGKLGIASMLVLPLSDGKDQVGLLVLTQNMPRAWHPGDVVMLKSLSEQVVIALNNAGLRRLVKNLSVTDEHSGLLKRASYLDLLLGETRRALQQKTPLSVLLMQVGVGANLSAESVQGNMMQEVSQVLTANIRQNDLAFRYDAAAVAVVLGETAESEALLAFEKLRKLLGQVKVPGKDEALPISGGVAEVVIKQQFDPVDSVTEVINRVEQALDSAVKQGPGKVIAQPPAFASAAVA